jgi:hypothetical protein
MKQRKVISLVGAHMVLSALACGQDDAASGGSGGSGGASTGGQGGTSSTGGAEGTGGSSSGTGGGVDAGDADQASETGGTGNTENDGGESTTDGATADANVGDGGSSSTASFFVTSTKSMTGNLEGLTGADKRCQDLAMTIGLGSKTWHAYLSVEHGPTGAAVNANTRIGQGPWYNVHGDLVALNLTELHARKGDYKIFIDEHGNFINGQWPKSPAPVEHDILTGSKADGTVLANQTCKDWTSAAAADHAQVGHSDGLGPGGDTSGTYTSWNSAHENGGCNNTAPRGGAGRLYCFAIK